MSASDVERLRARLAIVEEHVRCENRHDLVGLMATFGADARYDVTVLASKACALTTPSFSHHCPTSRSKYDIGT